MLSEQERTRLSRPLQAPGPAGLAAVLLGLAAIGWSWRGSGFSISELIDGLPRIGDFLARLWPPDFDRLPRILGLLRETLQMAVLGTALGAVLSLVIAFGATSTIAPRWLYALTRLLLNVLRSVPDLIYALVFVSAVGLGPFAGILALTLGSVGSIGKVYAEAMEAVDEGPVEAVTSTGASRRQVITWAVLPQSAPVLISYTLLLFEGNVRGATILGLVGAGGIGMELTTAMRLYDYGHLFAIIISIIVLVTVIDHISAVIRHRVI